MGDTKVKVDRVVRLTRIILSGIVLFFAVVAILQVVLFPIVTIKFETGANAQQIDDMQVKKGTDVELPVPLKAGSYFVGWSLQRDSTETIKDLKNVYNGTTLYAVWDGIEKYSVLTVNGVVYDNINIFDTKDTGISLDDLNASWRVPDDFDPDNENVDNFKGHKIDYRNNFRRFLGWRYRNANNQDEELRYEDGEWTWLRTDAQGNAMEPITITNETCFFPPIYRTVFTAILDYRRIVFDIRQPNGVGSIRYETIDPNAAVITMPDCPTEITNFAYWQIKPGKYSTYAAAAGVTELLQEIPLQYEANEVLKLDPLLYYFGNDMLPAADDNDDVVVYIILQAVTWDDPTALGQFTMQLVTDTNLGNEKIAITPGTYDDLRAEASAEAPARPIVLVDHSNVFNSNKELWFMWDDSILSYCFYDHLGNYHEIETTKFSSAVSITLGDETASFGDQQVYFNTDRAINIKVVYKKSITPITLQFNYGTNLTTLPNYVSQKNAVVHSFPALIGTKFIMPNAENYLRNDWLFYGWRLKGTDPDDEAQIYCAGETFVVAPYDTAQGTLFEFEAVWRMSRLLFDFDFGAEDADWDPEHEPNFAVMKGVFGESVTIMPDVPVRFGYTFLGWTLNDGSTLLQAGQDTVSVKTTIQTLHAHWQAKELVIRTYIRTGNSQQWAPRIIDGDYWVEDAVKLPTYNREVNDYFYFDGWQIGDAVLPGNATLVLTADVIKQLNYVDHGDYISVEIYAAMSEKTANIAYYVEYTDNTGHKVIEPMAPETGWATVVTQGAKFSQYEPFSIGNNHQFDMKGGEFIAWQFIRNGNGNGQGVKENIESWTTVPAGVKNIEVYTYLEQKNYTVEYYGYDNDFRPQYYTTDTHTTAFHYGDTVDLLTADQISLPKEKDGWGTFVGWSFDPDYLMGNPPIIYDVLHVDQPSLLLSDYDQSELTASQPYYHLAIDRHDEPMVGRYQYKLKLYAVYALDYVEMTYTQSAIGTLQVPVFKGDDHSTSVMGGSTVSVDDEAFADWGLVVRDDADLTFHDDDRNFIGWRVEVNPGADSNKRNALVNKLWFPGEAIPSVDFGLTFVPEYMAHGEGTKTVGNKTYYVVSLSPRDVLQKRTINNPTEYELVVVLPRADNEKYNTSSYTVPTDNLTINSNTPVHVVVSAAGNITLAPRAIKCDQVQEFYVGDNLNITGSPIYGAKFQNYTVMKGYHVIVNMNDKPLKPTEQLLEPSTKYNYAAARLGLLVDQTTNTLLGVPSHTQLTTTDLRRVLDDFAIEHLASNALLGINTMERIDLAKDNLTMANEAIFSSTANTIILPASATYQGDQCQIADDVIAGWHHNLRYVYFGENQTSNYATVEQGIVYYGRDKSHVMYVLVSATLNNLLYSTNDLRLPDSVIKINDYALAGRFSAECTAARIKSVSADQNNTIDLSHLLGLPVDAPIPLFVSASNPNCGEEIPGGSIQTYEKKLIFSCTYDAEQGAQTLTYVYGQNFTIFDPKDNNPHNFKFDRPWYKFVAWIGPKGVYPVNKVYKVGVDAEMRGDGCNIEFNANEERCWQSYPVRFHIFNGSADVEYRPATLQHTSGKAYTIEEINQGVGKDGVDLTFDHLYLPGVETTFTVGQNKYQFVGWGIAKPNTSFDNSHLWNKADSNKRFLPDKTRAATLDKGVKVDNAYYNYYALYDLVSDNLKFTLENGTYTVRGNSNSSATSICVPFAKYANGYMAPVTKIAANAFSSGGSNIKQIVIGGAVNEIGDYAFYDVDAKVTFSHQGRYIQYNNSGITQLTIGKYAFYRNDQIDLLTLPAALTTIKDSAFASCINLQSIIFETTNNAEPALRSLGNFVFSDCVALRDNAVVTYITNDRKGTNQRFTSMGDGIFMNTNVQPVGTNKIIWLNRLLYVYGGSGSLRITEEEIGGYAFANLPTAVTEIVMANPNVTIKKDAFANLAAGVTSMNLILVNPKRIEDGAFNKISHKVNVSIGERTKDWERFLSLESQGWLTFAN